MLCWDDWELGFRLLLQQPRIAYMGDRVRVHVISTADSITGTEFSSRCGLWERAIDAAEALLRSHKDCNEQDAKHCERLLRQLEFRRIALAAEYRREHRLDLALPLYRATMSRCRSHAVMCWLYPLCYRYIARGGRGISHLVKLLVK